MILSRPLLMFMALNVVLGVLVSQASVPFVVRPAIYPGPVHSRAFAGVASSPVTWLVSVGRPGASLVLRPPRMFRHRLRLLSIPIPTLTLILFPLRPILFLSLIPFLMIRLHLLQPLFRLTRPLLLMTIHRTKHVKRLQLVTPEDGEVVMSYDLSVADASPPRRPRPRVPSSLDYKKLVRLVLPKVKLVFRFVYCQKVVFIHG